MLHVGNSKYRFIIYTVHNGLIHDYQGEALELHCKDTLRLLSNSIFRSYPDLVANSILNKVQKNFAEWLINLNLKNDFLVK